MLISNVKNVALIALSLEITDVGRLSCTVLQNTRRRKPYSNVLNKTLLLFSL